MLKLSSGRSSHLSKLDEDNLLVIVDNNLDGISINKIDNNLIKVASSKIKISDDVSDIFEDSIVVGDRIFILSFRNDINSFHLLTVLDKETLEPFTSFKISSVIKEFNLHKLHTDGEYIYAFGDIGLNKICVLKINKDLTEKSITIIDHPEVFLNIMHVEMFGNLIYMTVCNTNKIDDLRILVIDKSAFELKRIISIQVKHINGVSSVAIHHTVLKYSNDSLFIVMNISESSDRNKRKNYSLIFKLNFEFEILESISLGSDKGLFTITNINIGNKITLSGFSKTTKKGFFLSMNEDFSDIMNTDNIDFIKAAKPGKYSVSACELSDDQTFFLTSYFGEVEEENYNQLDKNIPMVRSTKMSQNNVILSMEPEDIKKYSVFTSSSIKINPFFDHHLNKIFNKGVM